MFLTSIFTLWLQVKVDQGNMAVVSDELVKLTYTVKNTTHSESFVSAVKIIEKLTKVKHPTQQVSIVRDYT